MTQTLLPVFRQALAVTGKGLLALFAFMLLFFIMLVLIDRVFPAREDSEK